MTPECAGLVFAVREQFLRSESTESIRIALAEASLNVSPLVRLDAATVASIERFVAGEGVSLDSTVLEHIGTLSLCVAQSQPEVPKVAAALFMIADAVALSYAVSMKSLLDAAPRRLMARMGRWCAVMDSIRIELATASLLSSPAFVDAPRHINFTRNWLLVNLFLSAASRQLAEVSGPTREVAKGMNKSTAALIQMYIDIHSGSGLFASVCERAACIDRHLGELIP